jgi:hypothetical protein
MMASPVVEIVQFRLKAEVDSEAFLAAAADVQVAVATLAGYVGRELLMNDAGGWMDGVHGRSMADALAAAEVFPTLPAAGPFVALIDERSMTMQHLHVAKQFA